MHACTQTHVHTHMHILYMHAHTLSMFFRTHSNLADFIITRAVPALPLAFSSSLRALSYSPFSLSSFTAANQMSSLFGLAWKARARMDLAAGTSPFRVWAGCVGWDRVWAGCVGWDRVWAGCVGLDRVWAGCVGWDREVGRKVGRRESVYVRKGDSQGRV